MAHFYKQCLLLGEAQEHITFTGALLIFRCCYYQAKLAGHLRLPSVTHVMLICKPRTLLDRSLAHSLTYSLTSINHFILPEEIIKIQISSVSTLPDNDMYAYWQYVLTRQTDHKAETRHYDCDLTATSTHTALIHLHQSMSDSVLVNFWQLQMDWWTNDKSASQITHRKMTHFPDKRRLSC